MVSGGHLILNLSEFSGTPTDESTDDSSDETVKEPEQEQEQEP